MDKAVHYVERSTAAMGLTVKLLGIICSNKMTVNFNNLPDFKSLKWFRKSYIFFIINTTAHTELGVAGCHSSSIQCNVCVRTWGHHAWTIVAADLGWVNTLRPRQNGRPFADDTFKRIFLNENVGISIKISLKFVHKGPIDNIPALVQIMAWRRPGDKPLSEPVVTRLATHICVTRPQWVNSVGFEEPYLWLSSTLANAQDLPQSCVKPSI